MSHEDKKRLQEIFDLGAVGILRQGKRSLQSPGTSPYLCAYRSADGCKCLIGFAIPDDRYAPDLEGCSTYDQKVLDVLGVSRDLAEPLSMLQRIHDSYAPEFWRESLQDAAVKLGLDTNCLDEFRAKESQ